MRQTHIFDVDHTLLKASTWACFIREGLKKKVLRLYPLLQIPFYLLRYRQARLDDKVLEGEIKVLRNLKKKVLFDLGKASFEHYAKKNIYPQATRLIKKLQQEDATIIIASSSLDFLLFPVAEYFGIKHIVSSEMEFKNNTCTGRTLGKPAFGDNKKIKTIEYLKKMKISTKDCTFYSDSYYDLPLFNEVSNRIVINPDKKLKKTAIENEWRIKYFKINE